MDNNLTFIGLMKRAGALGIGADRAWDAARDGKARILLLAGDAAKNTMKGAANIAEQGVPTYTLPYTKAQLGAALGQQECAALAVIDTGFALSLCQKMGYEAEQQRLSDRLAREKRRKMKRNSTGQKRGKAYGCKQN